MKRDKNADTFNTDSASYAAFRPEYPAELFEFLAELCDDHLHVWDCACGNGQVSKSLVNYFSMVSATDISENQLKNAYQHPSIKYSIQKSEHTDFTDNVFDLVCVAQALHWFEHELFFQEVNRVLKPGGIFACWGYSFFSIDPLLDDIINTILFEPLREYWSEKNKLLWNGYSDIQFPFKALTVPEIKMSVEWNKTELIDYIMSWSAYKLYQEADEADIIDSFLSETRLVWNDKRSRVVNMDFTFYCGRKEN